MFFDDGRRQRSKGSRRRASFLLDLDRAVAAHCVSRSPAEPTDIEVRMTLHLEAIMTWLAQQPGT
jgi:hypothetical protein